jgi:hypothetical protein
LPQRFEQVFDGPLRHPGRTLEAESAIGKCNHRRQKPHRRSAVGHKQIAFGCRNLPAATHDSQRAAAVVHSNRDPQPLQGPDHDLRIFAGQRAAEQGRPVGKRRTNQRAIGNALRARRPHGGLQRAGRLNED